ncbi:hypothetical protein M434DRAFT_375138 [Hypoxylon sp. CO27-5]|nr:hypothetical protein M434DRAFT_375138 [Hypoxylon sp. CO27-5]
MSRPFDIRIGVWTNWSRGPIFGATLTLNRQVAALLIALTAIFVGYVGTRFWRIACLVVHRCQSSPEPQNTIYHQRQAILRNSASAESGIWALIKILWTWRYIEKKPLPRIFPSIVAAASCVVVFIIAGGLSSRISSSVGNEVLIESTNCGIIIPVNTIEYAIGATLYVADQLKKALTYAQECYSSNGSGTINCDLYVVKRLPTWRNNGASCPFPGNICQSNSSNLFLDTGLMDSHDHFGINFPVTERVLWRKALSCAPLITSGYTDSYTDGSGNVTRYYYGQAISWQNTTQNFTYEAQDIKLQYLDAYNGDDMRWVDGTIFLNSSYFEPISELRRPDGDLVVLFLSGNGVAFTESSHDDWYRATAPYGNVSSEGFAGQHYMYRMSEAASPLGCIEQYQLCTTSPAWCSPLASLSDTHEAARRKLGNITTMAANGNVTTSVIYQRLEWLTRVQVAAFGDLYSVANILGSHALASQQRLTNSIQGPLVDNQWKVDITQMWEIGLAALQKAFLTSASNVSDPELAKAQLRPTNQEQYDICQNLKIRNSEYTSFSLFWLIFTYGVGTLIILVSCSLEPLLGCLYRRWEYEGYRYLEWVTNGTLQLQRLAYEDEDSDIWSRCVEDIPVTEPGVKLGGLDLRDPEHPRFAKVQMIGRESPSNEEARLLEHKYKPQ